MRPVRGPHLHQAHARLDQDLGHPEGAPDLHQLAPGNHDLAPPSQAVDGEEDRRRIVVDRHRGLRPGKQPQQGRDPCQSISALSALEVELQVRVGCRGLRSCPSGPGSQNGPTQIGMEDDPGGIDHPGGTGPVQSRGQLEGPRSDLQRGILPSGNPLPGLGHRPPGTLVEAPLGQFRGLAGHLPGQSIHPGETPAGIHLHRFVLALTSAGGARFRVDLAALIHDAPEIILTVRPRPSRGVSVGAVCRTGTGQVQGLARRAGRVAGCFTGLSGEPVGAVETVPVRVYDFKRLFGMLARDPVPLQLAVRAAAPA